MTDRPTVSEYAEDLYAGMSPAMTHADDDWELLWFCECLSRGSKLAWGIGQDRWRTVLDPDLAPAESLGYASQFSGTLLKNGWSEGQKRTALRSPSNFYRGRPERIVQICQRHLLEGSSETVILQERQPTAYSIYIRTRIDETPDPAALEAELRDNSNKIAGLKYDYAAIAGQDFLQLSQSYATFSGVKSNYATMGDVKTNL